MRADVRCADDWPDFAGSGWESRVMAEDVTDRLHQKQGRSIARWTLTAEDGRTLVVFLKRFYVLPRWRAVLARLWPWKAWSPGMQEGEHLEWARRRGVPVPRVVASGEFVGPGLRLQGFLAVEELTGMLPLHEAIPLAKQYLSIESFATFKRGLGAEMARLTRLLHSRAVFHKDLYLCHFYVPERFTREPPTDWRNRVVVIDLHRLSSHPLSRWWWQVKDLAQLLYSSDVDGVGVRDRLRFWRSYRVSRSGLSARLLRRLIRLKGARYARHNEKRRKG